MRIHTQRKLVLNLDEGRRELAEFDKSVFPAAEDVQIAILQDNDGLWLTVVQDTSEELDDVLVLPGFQRLMVKPIKPGRTSH
jgi:hypothetical protein